MYIFIVPISLFHPWSVQSHSGIGTHSSMISSPEPSSHRVGSIRHISCNYSQSLQFSLFSHSTRYPSLLGLQRQHEMRSLPDTYTTSRGNQALDLLIFSPLPCPPHSSRRTYDIVPIKLDQDHANASHSE